jgi:hypothetical protein
MAKIQLTLKDRTVIPMEHVTTINMFPIDNEVTFTEDGFDNIPLDPNASYSFVGSDETIILAGADILCIAINKL